MNLLHADAKYADTLERSAYNGVLAGIDLGGEKFFYVNPLASDGKHHRQAFFGCACCPTNVVRFIPSVPGYVYATAHEAIYVNLYAAGEAKVPLGKHAVALTQQTRYPWDGDVKITVRPDADAGTFDVMLRIPEWTAAEAPKDALYQPAPLPADQVAPTIKVNGQAVAKPEMVKGYARLHRKWTAGDTIELNLPMPVRRMHAHPKVAADAGRVALQRGPIVYCFEGVDNGGKVDNFRLPPDAHAVGRVPKGPARRRGGHQGQSDDPRRRGQEARRGGSARRALLRVGPPQAGAHGRVGDGRPGKARRRPRLRITASDCRPRRGRKNFKSAGFACTIAPVEMSCIRGAVCNQRQGRKPMRQTGVTR